MATDRSQTGGEERQQDEFPAPGAAGRRGRLTAGRRVALGASLAGLALLAAACGSSAKATSSSPTTATPAAASSGTAGGSTAGSTATVTATLTDFHIALSPATLGPGHYTVTVKNAGQVPHSIVFSGTGGSQGLSQDVQPGQTATMPLTLQSGTYDVFCPVPGHKAMGMDLQLQVTAAGAATTAGTAGAPSTTAHSGGYGGGY